MAIIYMQFNCTMTAFSGFYDGGCFKASGILTL